MVALKHLILVAAIGLCLFGALTLSRREAPKVHAVAPRAAPKDPRVAQLLEVQRALIERLQKLERSSGDASSLSKEDAPTRDVSERLQALEDKVGNVPSVAEAARMSARDNVRVPLREGKVPDLHQRLRYLELKVDTYNAWVRQPHLWREETFQCQTETFLVPEGLSSESQVGLYDHSVCFDNWDFDAPCVVYDFGIHQHPEFGREMHSEPRNCEVHAFDPSPVTLDWVDGSDVVKLDNYHFHPYGAGGLDGDLTLYEYWDWDQISIINVPPQYDHKKRETKFAPNKPILVPVRTLGSIMAELGHTYIDVLKIDVEGSEYTFLEEMFDSLGCPPVGQIALEWHHFGYENRYGSSPELNSIVSMLHSCGFRQFWTRTEWVRRDDFGHDYSFNLASFCKDCTGLQTEDSL